jgi:maltooligosyltrehalose trehalohydrolase
VTATETAAAAALERGARVVDGGVAISVWAPAVERLAVVVESGAAQGTHALERGARGVWSGTIARMAAGDDYRLRLDDDDALVPDPVSRHLPEGPHGPTRVVDPSAFRWTDGAWRGRTMAELVLYELHVGTFTEAGTFDGVAERLGDLAALGVTAIELMPVAQFPGTRNWGYDGVGLYAPQDSYGGPEGLRRLVDAAHRAGLAVVLDVVYNHLGPEGNYLGRFGPYFTDRYKTPWGAALNYDGEGSDEVRRFVIDNARHWVREYRLDGLRLDAVHSIFDFSARHLLEELADAVRTVGASQGRDGVVIAESDLNDPRLVRPPERGGYGLDAQWSDDFHHAVHAALTGERRGYYEDFGGVGPVAESLERRFVYAGRYSPHRGRRHGAPATDVPADRFVVSVQNHDQVGNRAAGDRFGTLLPQSSQRLAAALLLLSPYVPMIFMGEEWGETNPFQYFVSHGDPELADAVREGRRREFASFGWKGEVPDPLDPATFERSRLDWARRSRAPHDGILALYRDLLSLRRSEPALRPGAAEIETRVDPSAGWVQLRLAPVRGGGAELLAVFNFTEGDSVSVPLRIPGSWRLLLSTDDAKYGGQGLAASDGVALTLPGRGAALFRGGGDR